MNSLVKYNEGSTVQQGPDWLKLLEPAIFKRAAMVALVLGSILTLVNQPAWITGAEPVQLLQLVLVFLLPFAVVTSAQIAGVQRAKVDSLDGSAQAAAEKVYTTIISHGIPKRAVIIALVIGSLNALAVFTHALWYSINLAAVPLVPLVQADLLPLVFGLLSQTFAYRRARFKAAGLER